MLPRRRSEMEISCTEFVLPVLFRGGGEDNEILLDSLILRGNVARDIVDEGMNVNDRCGV